MHTISNILQDVARGCIANNMIEDKFTYRLVYFINAENGSEKHYIDTQYDGLRIVLENIIRGNLTATNNIVIAAITALKDGKSVSLLSRSYGFSLNTYFKWINGEREYTSRNYGRRRAQWY